MHSSETDTRSGTVSRRTTVKALGIHVAGVGLLSSGRTSRRRGQETTTSQPPRRAETGACSGEWEENAPHPVAVSDAGGGVVDGSLYLFGGFTTGTELSATRRTYAYTPTAGGSGAWHRRADLPKKLWAPCGVATEETLYSFGGAPPNSPYDSDEPPTDEILAYTPGDGWENLTDATGVRCPYPNWAMKGVYDPATELIYCLGGGTTDIDRESATNHGVEGTPTGSFDESRIWTFDPQAEQVAEPDLARLPTAKRWPTVALVEQEERRYIYALGGLLGTTGPTDSNVRFDIEGGTWERRQPTPQAGGYGTTSNPVVGDQVYLTHGLFWSGTPTVEDFATVCHRYDPTTDSFATDLVEPRYPRFGATSGVIDDALYVVGGHVKRYDQGGLHECQPYNEAFAPDVDC